MRYKGTLQRGAVVGSVCAAFGIGMAVGQNTAPTENKGISISPATVLDLTSELDSLEGRQLRLRTITIEPGGVVGVHSHAGRPAVAYVLQGTIIEHREGEGARHRRQGDTLAEGKATTHWTENKGTQPAILVAVDVFKP